MSFEQALGCEEWAEPNLPAGEHKSLIQADQLVWVGRSGNKNYPWYGRRTAKGLDRTGLGLSRLTQLGAWDVSTAWIPSGIAQPRESRDIIWVNDVMRA